jgi:rRNA maturation endonuclease Nob1
MCVCASWRRSKSNGERAALIRLFVPYSLRLLQILRGGDLSVTIVKHRTEVNIMELLHLKAPRATHGLYYCRCADPRRATCASCGEDFCQICGGRIVEPDAPDDTAKDGGLPARTMR